jgi:hypothetical protein
MPILGLLWRYAGRRARAMTPSAFIKKWKASNLKEQSAAHEHFIDLCRLLDEAVAQPYVGGQIYQMMTCSQSFWL